jgi:hypothetical protein
LTHLTVIWTLRVTPPHRRASRITIARRTVTLRARRSARVRIALSRTGRRALAHSRRPRLIGTATLTESGRTIPATAQIRLLR